jgi:predicted small lipoprotein YifL
MTTKKTSAWLLLFAALLIAFPGCSKKGPSAEIPKSTKAAASQLEQAFANSSDERAKQQAAALANALEQRNYQQALESMAALRRTTARDFDQVVAVENANRRLQADVLRGVEAGDPNAIRTWQLMKAARRD